MFCISDHLPTIAMC